MCLLIIDYGKFITRILAILQNDKEFAKLINSFRAGDMPDITSADYFPLCYVTTAATPVVERRSIHPSGDIDIIPQEKVILEFWVRIVTTADIDQTSMQAELHDISSMAEAIFSRHQRLDLNGEDPLCVSSRVHLQGRMEQFRGQLKEAMTIRIRPVIYLDYDAS